MSKSLGNVIEPFQVVELYGADALRYYALREVRFGQDGEVSPEGFETRYTTELANEYGNLASRTLAMIDRYRDGVRAGGRARLRAGGRLRGPDRDGRGPARPGGAVARARRDLAAGQAPQPLRAGRGAVEAVEGRGRGRAPRPGALLAGRGAARGLGAAARLHARVGRAAARRARARGPVARQRPLRRAARRRAASRSSGSSSRAWRPPRPRPPERRRAAGGRHPLPPGLLRAARRRARRAGARRRRHARRHRGHGRALDRAGARGRPTSTRRWSAIVGRHPHETRRLRRRGPRGDRAGGRRSRGARHRRDGPRLLPRPRAARGPAPRLRGAAGARRRGSSCRGHPHPRRGGRHVRAAARARRRDAGGDPALLLGARPARRVRGARLPLLLRRQRDLSEGRGPPGGRSARARGAAAGGDRLALPRAAAAAGKAERAGQRDAHRALRGRAARRVRTRSSSAPSRPTPRGCSAGERAAPGEPAAPAPVRRAAQPRARPELPDRRQPPAA